jgi:hypothetical protein
MLRLQVLACPYGCREQVKYSVFITWLSLDIFTDKLLKGFRCEFIFTTNGQKIKNCQADNEKKIKKTASRQQKIKKAAKKQDKTGHNRTFCANQQLKKGDLVEIEALQALLTIIYPPKNHHAHKLLIINDKCSVNFNFSTL